MGFRRHYDKTKCRCSDDGYYCPDTGNMTAAGMMMKPGQNITSSINLMNIIHQAIGSKINVSLSDAATTAEASVGNGSHAVAAHIDEQNGYLVYNVMVIDPSMNFSKVIVDPGNGQVLLSKQISKEEHMRIWKDGFRNDDGRSSTRHGNDDGTNAPRYDGRISWLIGKLYTSISFFRAYGFDQLTG
jgi:hypothetical protein